MKIYRELDSDRSNSILQICPIHADLFPYLKFPLHSLWEGLFSSIYTLLISVGLDGGLVCESLRFSA